MSKKIIIFAGIVLALFAVYKLGGHENKQVQVQNNQSASVVSVVEKNAVSNSDSNIGSSKNSATNLVKVTRVIDGDTIEIDGGERVRYIGIDTPETVDPRKTVQCFGVEASGKNKEMVEGKMVRLEKDVTDRDRYNRLLRYVWLDDTLINLTLVENGFAHSYSYPPDIKYQDQFVAAEKSARENKIGLWTACSSEEAETIVNEESSKTKTQQSALDPSCTIKGNISTSGEKIYHAQGCGSYTKTKIEENRGERWFCSEAEAQSAGWRKALNCP